MNDFYKVLGVDKCKEKIDIIMSIKIAFYFVLNIKFYY